MVNKDQIHGELSYFQGITSNSIKTDEELSWEIWDFSNFRKRIQEKSTK